MTARESLTPLFSPESIAVIGASRDPDSLGFKTLEALVMNRFQGPVYPVNPKARSIGSLRAYPTVGDVPDQVDLAIIIVPVDAVLGVVDECAAKGVRALVVITAGFAETGDEGRRLQDELTARVTEHGMRLVGPNCMGVVSTDPAVSMNATFTPVFPPPGGIAMVSQSGALGLAVLSLAQRRGLGLSSFVSVGNTADVSGNDLLEYWEHDPRTRVILLYLESFGQPRRFASIARRVTRTKPIVAVKSGRTGAGRRAAGSHTAALAGSDTAASALFRQTGVVRARTLNEMFDVALALDCQPLPGGRRVAILTNAGGPGILCADAAEASGLVVPELSDQTIGELRGFLPSTAGLANPVDMIASAGPENYRRSLEVLLQAPEVDALVVIYIPIEQGAEAAVRASIGAGLAAARSAAAGMSPKPVYLVMMTEEGVSTALDLEGEAAPSYPFPEQAARALAKVADYAALRDEPMGTVLTYEDQDLEAADAVCRGVLETHGPGWLSADEAREVLSAAGFPVMPGGVAQSPGEAAEIAAELGFPVALKLASRSLVHKTEFDAVRLGLTSPAAVADAYHGIRGRLMEKGLEEAMDGALVQPMVAGGVEVMIGAVSDPAFGPLVSFGLGGIHVEILADVAFRVAPLTDRDADSMVREIRGYRLLEGYRGHPPADVTALETLVQKASRLVESVASIQELDLNPVFALAPGRGCAIVDARIRIDQAP